MPIPASWLRKQWRMQPDRVTAGYRATTGVGTYAAAVSVRDCWWRPAEGGVIEAAPSAGAYTAAHRTWYFPKGRYAGVPAVGDVLDGPASAIDPVAAAWTVLGVDHAGALGCWALLAVSLQLQAALRGTLTFSRPDNTRDAAGRPALTNYTAYASAVPARVQPQDGAAGEVMGRVTVPRRFTAYLGTRTAVRGKDRAHDGATYYTVVESSMPERLDVLQEVTLEQVL